MSTDANPWMIEYWLNLACASHIKASGILEVNSQKDNTGLVTPRVEVKTIWNGWNEHRVNTPGGIWFDMGIGKLAFKVVTRRTDESGYHDRVVGTIRYLMQLVFGTDGYTPGDPNPKTLSDYMPWHRIAKITDAGAVPSFIDNQMQDITALSFNFVLQLRTEKLPQS